ncbi:uncharacterized protein LOC131235128 isoform X1 [Magnolia sinica]|uniref:uncharacterized protein LOC131235128 isoform X1 n=2 Tax=Magnolia sinica TaxID=86752 RepID=UPI002659F687|nr:uncharacterized protein LOC131235128 isoform X1 [Magnolia sinica]
MKRRFGNRLLGVDLFFKSVCCIYLRMGDHFVLLVDRLITESTIDAAIESRNQSQIGQTSALVVEAKAEFSSPKQHFGNGSSPQKLAECRICQDEDDDSNMETPCSCCGSLKYAHRKCVQRWCNEKGDTMCEICHQQFKPGYTAPPRLFQYGSIPLNFRRNWEISRRDLHNPQFIAVVATDRDFMDANYDEYSSQTARSMICCRSVAVIFLILLVLRHVLPITVSGAKEYSFTIFILLLLRTVGILVPLYIMTRALTAIHRRRQQQESDESSLTTAEENGRPQRQLQPQPHLIHVH